ncbi:hypothetical protein [Erythrobacter alti]|uniref:hypothetical protein n=1 Tax=Erythrobacter alti TaxID=1896145 RepID=UPI0030F3FAA1
MGSSAISEGKSFASLGPMLLARKGTAKPAMRVQLEQSDRMAALTDEFDELAESQDALGWNDMGDNDTGDDQVISLPVANIRTAAKLAKKPAKVSGKAKAAKNGRAAFTLRIDPERHLKLRLASTLQNCSAQALVTDALDQFLENIPEIDALAARMRRMNKNS